jgi:hypothetical protein
VCPEKFEELAVKLVTVPILVKDISAAGVEDAERAAEIPEGIADLVGFQDIHDIAEPAEENVVGRFVVGAAFTAMDADTLFHELSPWGESFHEFLSIRLD